MLGAYYTNPFIASHCKSFGLLLTEAPKASCTIIASNVDSIHETLDNRQIGILVLPKDIQIFSSQKK
ncbi:group 1 glycosyl transferase [Nostoc sp. NIES-4103]|nr:group 1 glycosyl transferase [Nostoc sp. NIES-4103]